jgi:hypothetical protein
VIWFISLCLAFSFMSVHSGLFPPREKFVGKNIIVLKMPHMSTVNNSLHRVEVLQLQLLRHV